MSTNKEYLACKLLRLHSKRGLEAINTPIFPSDKEDTGEWIVPTDNGGCFLQF